MEDEKDPLLGRSNGTPDLEDTESGRRKYNALVAVLAVLFVAAVAVIAVLASKDTIDPGQETMRLMHDNLSLNIRTAMSDTADPCEDFYTYACGGWLSSTSIPPDKNAWSRSFSVIHERSISQLREILEESDKTLEGKFYQSCMDDDVNQKGATPMKPIFDIIENRLVEVGPLVMSAVLMRQGVGSLLGIGVEADAKNPQEHILAISQGGLGLPDRQYYFDENQASLRDDYMAHIAKMLELSGLSSDAARAEAHAVMDIETKLAEASLKREDMRDPDRLYNKRSLEQLQSEIAPGLDWTKYFTEALTPDGIDVAGDLEINVATLPFFSALPGVLNGSTTDHLKSYFRFHAIHSYSPALSDAIRTATFEFYGQRLNGQEQQPPRWKKCVAATDDALGDALGKTYTDLHFSSDDKRAAQDLIRRVEDAFQHRLVNVSWMSDATRTATIEKLHMIANNVGYPDKWLDYSSLQLGPNYFENDMASRQLETSREFKKLNKPVDRNEWEMSAPTVNAYYDPSKNKMVFPAGILQYPFFERTAPAAVNYGAIGSVMGHELTHAFDDEGRKFDGEGKLRDWWDAAAVSAFETEAKCVSDQFSQFTVPGATDDSKLNGKLTLGENIADLGGVKSAFQAFQEYKRTRRPTQENIDHPASLKFLTEDQLFFVSYGQAWCEHVRDKYAAVLAKTDPHSPPMYRVMGPLANIPEFSNAFHCSPRNASSPTPSKSFVRRPEDQCKVW